MVERSSDESRVASRQTYGNGGDWVDAHTDTHTHTKTHTTPHAHLTLAPGIVNNNTHDKAPTNRDPSTLFEYPKYLKLSETYNSRSHAASVQTRTGLVPLQHVRGEGTLFLRSARGQTTCCMEQRGNKEEETTDVWVIMSLSSNRQYVSCCSMAGIQSPVVAKQSSGTTVAVKMVGISKRIANFCWRNLLNKI